MALGRGEVPKTKLLPHQVKARNEAIGVVIKDVLGTIGRVVQFALTDWETIGAGGPPDMDSIREPRSTEDLGLARRVRIPKAPSPSGTQETTAPSRAAAILREATGDGEAVPQQGYQGED